MNAAYRGKVQIVAVGDDLGFELPRELIARHGLSIGDTVFLSWSADSVLLTFQPPQSQAAGQTIDREGS